MPHPHPHSHPYPYPYPPYARGDGYAYYNGPAPPLPHHYPYHHPACNESAAHAFGPQVAAQKSAPAPSAARSNEAEQDAVEILLNMRNR
jgi:hypothetical protein